MEGRTTALPGPNSPSHAACTHILLNTWLQMVVADSAAGQYRNLPWVGRHLTISHVYVFLLGYILSVLINLLVGWACMPSLRIRVWMAHTHGAKDCASRTLHACARARGCTHAHYYFLLPCTHGQPPCRPASWCWRRTWHLTVWRCGGTA